MSWSSDLRRQVRREFAEAARHRGCMTPDDDEEPERLGPPPAPKRRSARVIPHQGETS